ncbi:hypothetical protein HYALB_00009520 [Hymenoscyphus albidus]|uniref:Uncharacterized protein n=1 Tax=Hymenoscyphus albidus TaxID=595503 RepID=A0A9N9LHN7_9HELO|nr:hypothetical protein HYALB_00009520 [Hymenoscyphus albidus]
MHSKVLLAALATVPLVAAHGKLAVVCGDMGGNTTALGITGGDVPERGPNKVTETDTTTFNAKNIKSNGLGKTTGQGNNKATMVTAAMAQSGNTLPQVAPGGTMAGIFHIVTTDGAGPIRGLVDETATGQFANGKEVQFLQQVPGNGGNIAQTNNSANQKAAKGARALMERALTSMGIIQKRAGNVDTDNPFLIRIPADTKCTGTVEGMTDVCMIKLANSNAAGPFGGVALFQVPAGGTATKAAPEGCGMMGGGGRAGQAAPPATGAAGATGAKKAQRSFEA